MDIFVTGTDTDVGKTVLSAVLVIALEAGYWKPIQTGRLHGRGVTDRETVLKWTELEAASAPDEAYSFDPPVSPHLAAREAGTPIELSALQRPPLTRRLIIEGAGGAMVPINKTQVMLDLMEHFHSRVVVAARTSLGTINHTLLTIEAIRRRELDLAGVVLLGEESSSNREAIEDYGRVPVIGWIPPMARINRGALLEVFAQHFDGSVF